MSNNRKLGNLAQFLDSGSTKSVITVSGGAFATEPLLEADLTGTAPTGLSDSNLVKNLVDINYITETTGYASVSDAIPVILQNTNNIIPDSSGAYDLGDSAKPIAELILDSSANIFFGDFSLTSILRSGTSSIIASDGAAAVWYGDRGVWMGGDASGQTNTIDYIDITSAGNATDFGDLSEAKRKVSSFSDGTKGVSAGGQLTSNESTNVIEYITFATTGNAADFGDLSTAVHSAASSSDGTTGLMSGGKLGSSGSYAKQNIIQSVTIATLSNASDFGDLLFAQSGQGGCNDATYSITMGGEVSPYNNIEYVAIATPGNSADFGDLVTGRMYGQGLSDTTRGLYAGGYDVSDYTNTIEYITIATTGNGTDFGDLVGTATSMNGNGCSNATTGVFGGLYRTVTTNIMESVIIQTTGNATDFGDLTTARSFTGGTSGSPS